MQVQNEVGKKGVRYGGAAIEVNENNLLEEEGMGASTDAPTGIHLCEGVAAEDRLLFPAHCHGRGYTHGCRLKRHPPISLTGGHKGEMKRHFVAVKEALQKELVVDIKVVGLLVLTNCDGRNRKVETITKVSAWRGGR